MSKQHAKPKRNKTICKPEPVKSQKTVDKMREEFISHGQLSFKLTTEEDFGTAFIKAIGREKVIIS